MRFVGETLRRGALAAEPVPGGADLRRRSRRTSHNNRRDGRRRCAAQGYRVELTEVPDVHNYTAWRDAFDPHLTGLLRQVAAVTPLTAAEL